MNERFASRFTGGAFVIAALLLWLGWALLPVRIGTFFEPDVFARIQEQFRFWIWMYRFHLFGMILGVAALVALAALVADLPARVVLWPGVVIASAGLLVGALGEAFYYHHGAWGSLELADKSAADAAQFVANLRVDTEYVTCLVRFGRVFGGLGLVLVGWSLWQWRLLPRWVAALAGLIGLAAMALTMGLPDDLHLYQPVFHAFTIWLLATGVLITGRALPQHR